MLHLYFAADFDSVCFIWYGWVGASKLLHWIVKFINYANLCKFIQNQWQMLHLYFAADFDSVCFTSIWYGWVGASKLLHWIVKFINYANLCKFIQNQWKNATSPLFRSGFWFCLFYLIWLGGGFKTSTQGQIYSKSKLLLYFAADFDSVCFIWYGWVGLQNWIVKFINYANLCKFIQNQWKMLHLLYFAADFDSVCLIWYGWVGASKRLHWIVKFINYAHIFLCKFIQNQQKMLRFPLFRSGFWFCLFYLIGLGGASKLLHWIVKFIIYANVCKFIAHRVIYYPLVFEQVLVINSIRYGAQFLFFTKEVTLNFDHLGIFQRMDGAQD